MNILGLSNHVHLKIIQKGIGIFGRMEKMEQEPNNWESIFSGSAWEYDEANRSILSAYYSATKQPDLNWENTEVRQALYKMVNWWLDKGIDGFRVDAISHIKKE